ncbi:MAG: DUF4276 family protein [Anaerolineae bacterium]|nr:DUF4276 family protein [Anaerolineae bacterium]
MLLHFYVEELSAEAALVELVPRILPADEFEYDYDIFPFQGKASLLRNLPNRLKAYRHRSDDWRVIVLVDRDADDCQKLKAELDAIVRDSELKTRTESPTRFHVLNRIAIEELEAWFFGDVEALVTAYPRVDASLGQKSAYRDPDAIKGGTWEHLEKLLAFYHPGGLEKIRAAGEISRHMQPDRNRSKSFQVFRDGLRGIFA